ncbi:hypothetical protein PWT90_04296 [Aphanocladium album]|nr:hypothetical protein PWT90_04296 [Aphanocladium album]
MHVKRPQLPQAATAAASVLSTPPTPQHLGASSTSPPGSIVIIVNGTIHLSIFCFSDTQRKSLKLVALHSPHRSRRVLHSHSNCLEQSLPHLLNLPQPPAALAPNRGYNAMGPASSSDKFQRPGCPTRMCIAPEPVTSASRPAVQTRSVMERAPHLGMQLALEDLRCLDSHSTPIPLPKLCVLCNATDGHKL